MRLTIAQAVPGLRPATRNCASWHSKKRAVVRLATQSHTIAKPNTRPYLLI